MLAGMASSTSPHVRRWPRILARVLEGAVIALALGALLLWCSVPSTAQLAKRNPTSTAFIDLRREEAAAHGRPFELTWRWRPISEISRYLRAAIIYSEDYNFYRHDGVDWAAIEKAVDANWSRGSLTIGGSTITQQLAKNLYLSPSRSFVRKLREMVISFALEDHLSKQRILELYLNVVEWGDGVFGAEAAAQHWYKHSAQSLSPAEAVRLAIALPNPFKRAPNVRSPELTKKAVRLIRLLRMQGLIDAEQEREAYRSVGARSAKALPAKGERGHLLLGLDELDPDAPADPAKDEELDPPAVDDMPVTQPEP
ncbi:MAG: monofunctional biosynthetic peptidoglycan transglycosylase [Myxococcales bacterium]|nr:monofunctional biosynthetic peptidoglycan transglycosylase [Myxococcales bacterium]